MTNKELAAKARLAYLGSAAHCMPFEELKPIVRDAWMRVVRVFPQESTRPGLTRQALSQIIRTTPRVDGRFDSEAILKAIFRHLRGEFRLGKNGAICDRCEAVEVAKSYATMDGYEFVCEGCLTAAERAAVDGGEG